MKLYLVECLAKIDTEKVARTLVDIADNEPDADLRAAARAALRKHSNAVARAYR